MTTLVAAKHMLLGFIQVENILCRFSLNVYGCIYLSLGLSSFIASIAVMYRDS